MSTLKKIKSDLLTAFQDFVIGDGAMGTLLAPDIAYEHLLKANLEQPKLILNAHQDYVAAGAELILTNTFALSLDTAPPDEKVRIARQACQLTKQAGAKWWAYDLGPALPEQSQRERQLTYSQQAQIAVEENADALLLETFYTISELALALEAVTSCPLPLMVSVALLGEEDLASVLHLCQGRVAVLGINCQYGPSLLQSTAYLRQHWTGPLYIQPNRGIPDHDGHLPVSQLEFAGFVQKLIQLGVNGIGGCCGTTPETIHFIKKEHLQR